MEIPTQEVHKQVDTMVIQTINDFDEGIEVIEEITRKLANCDDLVIYLRSSGGDVSAFDTISHLINMFHSRIHLHAVSHISSSAFELFFDFQGERSIASYDTVAVIHAYSCTIGIRDLMDSKSWDSFVQLQVNRRTQMMLDKYSFLTEKEKKTIMKGGDVHLSGDRIMEMVKTNENE